MVALAQYWFIPLFSFIFSIILLQKWRSGPTRKNLHPSLKMLPIIRKLHQVSKLPHRSLYALSKRYGELMLLRFGSKSVLVASSAKAAREIMKKQDRIFANRPLQSMPGKLMYGSTDVAFATQGEHWKQVMGYHIPAGTQVLTNTWTISRDPALWENPEEFHPERFLDSDVDYRGQHFELVPFGSGRRACPGVSFGMGLHELGLAKLVRNFDSAIPNGGRGEDLDMSEAGGLAVYT